jgi:hypothetical protein
MESSSNEHQNSRRHGKVQKDDKDSSNATWTSANPKLKYSLALGSSLSLLLDYYTSNYLGQ